MWLIMRKFNVLPTEERFTKLTELQISYIVENMIEDAEQAKNPSKESDEDFYDTDDAWYEDDEAFEEAMGEIDGESIAKQVEELKKQMPEYDNTLSAEDRKEAQAFNKIQDDYYDNQVKENLRRALLEAKRRENIANGIFEEADDDEDEWI